MRIKLNRPTGDNLDCVVAGDAVAVFARFKESYVPEDLALHGAVVGMSSSPGEKVIDRCSRADDSVRGLTAASVVACTRTPTVGG